MIHFRIMRSCIYRSLPRPLTLNKSHRHCSENNTADRLHGDDLVHRHDSKQHLK
jgi:hypothetical protein